MIEYRKITKVRNLESAIQRNLPPQGTTNPDEIAEKTGKSKPERTPEEKKSFRKRVTRRISWGFLLTLIAIFIGMTVHLAISQSQLKAAQQLTDTRLLPYEEMVDRVKSVGLLFTIYDDDSYQRAKTSIDMSDELKATYFISDKYRGTTSEITLSWQDILYEITENDYVTYLLYFTTTQGDRTVQYVVQAEYTGRTLLSLTILNN